MIPHRIVVVGGGAGGLELATRLGERLGRSGNAHVILVDRSRTHLWKPLLHEVAAVAKGMGEAQGIAFFRKLAAMKPGIRSGHTLMAELVAAGEIDLALDAHVQGVARLKEKGAPIEWKALHPAFGQPSSVGVARQAPHPNAAILFAEFILSREGQEIIKSRNRVPSSTAVDSPLNKFRYALIDPAIMLEDWDKWSRLWSEIFLGGKQVAKEH